MLPAAVMFASVSYLDNSAMVGGIFPEMSVMEIRVGQSRRASGAKKLLCFCLL
jgi:hypothetical protein